MTASTKKPSETISNLCPACHIGYLHDEHSTYTQWHEGQLIVVPQVPAQVCDYCGETHFHPVVLERLHQLLWADTGRRNNFSNPPQLTRVPNRKQSILSSDP